MTTNSHGTVLLGRRSECGKLDDILAAARNGESGSLVVRGEAGIGKTALLEYLGRRASGCRIARVCGVESETELAYASLQQLCAPFLDRLDELPAPQRDAMGTAFGLRDGDPPDRFLVGLAALTLFATVAEERPLVCIIDDAQWVDLVSAQTLAFVARRLQAESIALIFAVREPTTMQHLDGLAEVQVSGLVDADAHALLSSALVGPVELSVRERIVAETHGNPLALLELPQRRSAADLAFGFQTPDLMPMATRIEQDFERRLEPLPQHTRQLLLIAAAEPVGDPILLERTADLLDIELDAAPAKVAGLIEFGEGIRFRHPLVRSAVYRAATPAERRAVHRALAQSTDPQADPDRRAWHEAQSSQGPDEVVAGHLEASADRAQRRGGIAAAAALLQRAVALTPDPSRRGGRALAAAATQFSAAAPEAAAELLAVALRCPLDESQRARHTYLQAQLLFARTRGSDAAALLLQAAKGFESVDVRSARDTYLEAIAASFIAGRLSGPHGTREVARAALATPASTGQPPLHADELLDGLATWLIKRDTSGFSAMRLALLSYAEAPLDNRAATMGWLRHVFSALQVCTHELWDFELWGTLATRAVSLSRELGALAVLPSALMALAGQRMHAGRLDAASALIDEGNAITAAANNAPVDYASLNMVGWRGDERVALMALDNCVPDATARGETSILSFAKYVTAVLYNGLGRYELALVATREAIEYECFSFVGFTLMEQIEAAVRCGAVDEARQAQVLLRERTRASGTDWALGVQARCDALLSDGDTAEALYLEAIDRLRRSQVTLQLARAYLLYGEWLRRQQRRQQARDHLRIAYDMLHPIGVRAFAERARRELQATGQAVRRSPSQAAGGLTAQELQIAQLAANGLTNPEIGAQLFISPHTVDWHLRKVFVKVNITSRRQLSAALQTIRP